MALNKYFIDIFTEMFKRVKLDFDPELIKSPDWYQLSSWTPEQMEDFKQWFINYVMTTPGAKKVLFPMHRHISKQDLDGVADMFLLQYGWTTQLEGENNGEA